MAGLSVSPSNSEDQGQARAALFGDAKLDLIRFVLKLGVADGAEGAHLIRNRWPSSPGPAASAISLEVSQDVMRPDQVRLCRFPCAF